MGPSHGHAGVEEFKAAWGAEPLACPMLRTEPRSWRTRLRGALEQTVLPGSALARRALGAIRR
jgi:hypothetical protein